MMTNKNTQISTVLKELQAFYTKIQFVILRIFHNTQTFNHCNAFCNWSCNIRASDFANLQEREAYILIPEKEVSISKTIFDIAASPTNIQPSYIENPQLETMIEERQNTWRMYNEALDRKQSIDNTQKVTSSNEDSEQKSLMEKVYSQKNLINPSKMLCKNEA